MSENAMAMTVSEAVESRRSIRAFTDRPVPLTILQDILTNAQRAPSGGTVQPWEVAVVTGDALSGLIGAVGKQTAMGLAGMQPEYQIYPEPLADPWMARRRDVAAAMYDAMGVERTDRAARDAAMALNFRGFGAPVVLFVHCPRFMGPPQWADMGIWLQTVMLLLREAGLDSCPQEAWAVYGKTIRDQLAIGDENMLYTGLAIGWGDHSAAVNRFAVPRAEVDDVVSWHGF